jgi:hypothetical protein
MLIGKNVSRQHRRQKPRWRLLAIAYDWSSLKKRSGID